MKRKIFVCCIAHRYTGGPTLAHQLCYKLRKFGYDAYMFYYFCKGEEVVNSNYKKYGLPYVDKIEDNAANIVITPETNVNLLRRIRYAKKVIWWMSVDNYFKSLKSKRNLLLDLGGLRRYNILRRDIFHFAQSYYALTFLAQYGVSSDRIFYLSDYLEASFINNSLIPSSKTNVVLYNPKKGFEFTEKIISHSSDLNWIPLENMTPQQLSECLKSGKVYIDFGNHPGKDRIPREAVVSGCCLITGKKGSAKFKNDVYIPDMFKFEDNISNIPSIIQLIRSILSDYDSYYCYFDEYKKRIIEEEDVFDKSVRAIFSSL